MTGKIREFGSVDEQAKYILRPGGYGVIVDDAGRVAVVRTPQGFFLPGGGQEADETPENALLREAREECGLDLRISSTIGIADEFIHARADRRHFQKRGTFFRATIVGTDLAAATEPDHRLEWLPAEKAVAGLNHQSHRWAVMEALPRP